MWCAEPGQLLVLPHEGDWVDGKFERIYSALTLAGSLKNLPPEIYDRVWSGIRRLGSVPTVIAVPEGEEERYAFQLARDKRVRAAIPNYHLAPLQQRLVVDSTSVTSAIKFMRAAPNAKTCGYGARVAILDTGIDTTLVPGATHIQPYQLNAEDPSNTNLFDDHGHGSLVATLIHSIAPSAELLSVKVLGKHGNTASLTIGLLFAMKAFEPHVINLSLALNAIPTCPHCGNYIQGTTDKQQLETILTHLTAGSNSIIIAAAGNGNSGRPLLPADCDGVLGVGSYDLSGASPVYRYRNVDPNRFVLAPGGTLSAPFGTSFIRDPRGVRLHGTSFAAACATGIAARHLCSQLQAISCPNAAIPGVSHREAVLQKIRACADAGFSGYKDQEHGFGVLRY